MLVSILANLVMEGGVIPPVTQHNVPDVYEEEKGGYGEKLKDEKTRKFIQQGDEEFLIMLSKWISDQNKFN